MEKQPGKLLEKWNETELQLEGSLKGTGWGAAINSLLRSVLPTLGAVFWGCYHSHQRQWMRGT